MAANILVVASQTAASHQLLDALQARAERSPIKITLVMPAQGPGLNGREAMRAQLDEAIVCTLPGRSSKWLEHDFPHRVARFTGVPVTHVVADDMRPAPATSPPPAHEKQSLGPLSVLSWGGRQSGSR